MLHNWELTSFETGAWSWPGYLATVSTNPWWPIPWLSRALRNLYEKWCKYCRGFDEIWSPTKYKTLGVLCHWCRNCGGGDEKLLARFFVCLCSSPKVRAGDVPLGSQRTNWNVSSLVDDVRSLFLPNETNERRGLKLDMARTFEKYFSLEQGDFVPNHLVSFTF